MDNQVPESGSESDNDNPPTPTPKPSAAGRHRGRGPPAVGRQVAKWNQEHKKGSKAIEKNAVLITRIEDRPFCTQQCLLGLACGGDLDDQCPNFLDHRKRHISRNTFLSLIRTQLTRDRGCNADCKPLHMKGSRGALLKVRLSAYGYTLVAKGMEEAQRKYLVHESEIYDRMHSIQGSCIPVSLGLVDLGLPYYYDGGVYSSILFLSWGGRPLYRCLTQSNESHILDQVDRTLRKLHVQQVLHKDAKLRNWLWDEQHTRLMLVDFERAEIRARLHLGTLSPNRKRNVRGKLKLNETEDDKTEDEFFGEIQSARASISRYIG